MSPEQRQIEELMERIEKLERAENVAFIQSLERRLNFVSGDISLTDLSDVTITSPTNGQVLKYNGTNWAEGTDNTA